MKAIEFNSYGDSSVLQLKEIAIPVPKAHEVLIKVVAVTINPFDIKNRSGAMKAFFPITFPHIPGTDASGMVEAVGSAVTRIKVGDLVFATASHGTYAEYVCINEATVSLIPDHLSMNEAAALAVPLNTAYSVLVETGHLQPGERVLIHGAAGGVGAIILQMAKALGAYVIATASGTGLDLIKSLAADEVIDYKSQDFSKLVKDLDTVVDLVGGETQLKSYPLVKKGGRLLSIVMPTSDELAAKHQINAQFISSVGDHKKLDFGKRLVDSNKIKVQVAKVMKIEEAAAAQDLVSKGGLNGKIVLNF
ncbi:NADP-dependent oxidoreductase [Pedobacter gandavensis]|uniref:Zinc-binding dehydrogenase n=1 Tax=Pedobacter gandavensis TaxID=2679963 RepID=A0ABR6EQY3_9SPHI|nr:NADP-dependent oxidoreductase [Pedobacter gandavensis]MBB2147669.1 zinc-binding dehydrogenase [Pedobacter gandavensis]